MSLKKAYNITILVKLCRQSNRFICIVAGVSVMVLHLRKKTSVKESY